MCVCRLTSILNAGVRFRVGPVTAHGSQRRKQQTQKETKMDAKDETVTGVHTTDL